MEIPAYWVKASTEESPGSPLPSKYSAWGWSSRNRAAAEEHANRRLASFVARIEAGEKLPRGYAYGNRPLREEILQELSTGNGAAIVSRNAYGSLVLNTEDALFLDIDIPTQSLIDRIRGFFGKRRPSREVQLLTQVREVLQGVAGASFRVYRTAAGIRVLGTDRTYPQGDQVAADLLSHSLVDRAYARLCEVQKSYRARLTPKPWRCGCDRPRVRFPYGNDSEQASFDQWLAVYEEASASRATCTLIEEVGWGRVSSEIAPIVELHDRATRIDSALPLA